MQHGTYDEFWQARNLRPHLKNIKPAVMTVGGWFDAENLFGALETYKNVEANSPGATNILVMGPWRHGGWSRDDGSTLGPVPFNSKTSEFYREQIEFPFFEYHLKGKGSPNFPEAWVFETGTNQWQKYDPWPPRNLKTPLALSARAGRALVRTARRLGATPSFDEYVSDPAHPVAYIDQIAIRMTGDYMIQDQRVASRRPDVLVYEGPGAHRGRDDRRPDRGSAVRLDDRDRLRLGRQADRRLSRRLSRPEIRTRAAPSSAATSSSCAAT